MNFQLLEMSERKQQTSYVNSWLKNGNSTTEMLQNVFMMILYPDPMF